MTKLSDTQRVILSRAAQHDALLATPPAKLPAAARQAVLRSMIAKGLLEEVPAAREAIALGWRQDEDGPLIALRITAAGLAAIGVEPEAPTSPEAVDDGDIAGELTSAAPAPVPSTELPTGPKGASLAAFPPAPPSGGGEAPEGPQRPPMSQHAPIGRAAALRMAATTVLTAWDAPERDGLDDAMAALRDALAASPRAARATRPPRDPAIPPQARTGTKQEAVLALLRRDEGTTIAEIIDATGWQPHTVRGFVAGLKRKGVTVEVLERVRQVGPNKQGAKGSYSIYRVAEAG
ncbi:DUF3489 domain-containing protein [Roseomonas fluvialis]|uniref:DUF3489 domain-containing protein n=1 Tax=Roseomonas fluvialis TaxID=1750527 RepID=A0ABM7Y7N2_9PROT|nr:DUF3489 domain-containing protein [Roseomonas fluvialis]BDG74045.1 hypothetical protein Rmf_39740 [Roseomonas fluvialis]